MKLDATARIILKEHKRLFENYDRRSETVIHSQYNTDYILNLVNKKIISIGCKNCSSRIFLKGCHIANEINTINKVYAVEVKYSILT